MRRASFAAVFAIVASSCQGHNAALSDHGEPDGSDDIAPTRPPTAPLGVAADTVPVASTITLLAGSTSDAGFADEAGSDARFNSPQDIAVDGAGNVYVADSGNGRIRKVTRDGEVTTLAVVKSPSGVAVNSAGEVYVKSFEGLFKISPTGTVTTVSATGLGDGRGLGIDTAGNIYAGDFDHIRRVATDGAVTTIAGSDGAGFADGTAATAAFYHPQDVAVDRAGNVFVTDAVNNRVRTITGSTVSTLAGSDRSGSVDGLAEGARFSGMVGIDVDRAGNVYVAESREASVIRRITPGGAVTTLMKGITYASSAAVGSAGTLYVTSGNSSGGGGAVHKITSVGIGELKVTWQALSSKSSVIGYTASATAAGQETQQCTSPGETTCTLHGLVTGVAYEITVTATNAAGTSTPSPPVQATPN